MFPRSRTWSRRLDLSKAYFAILFLFVLSCISCATGFDVATSESEKPSSLDESLALAQDFAHANETRVENSQTGEDFTGDVTQYARTQDSRGGPETCRTIDGPTILTSSTTFYEEFLTGSGQQVEPSACLNEEQLEVVFCSNDTHLEVFFEDTEESREYREHPGFAVKMIVECEQLGDNYQCHENACQEIEPDQGPQTPVPPSSLAATASSPTTIRLVWRDDSDNEEGFIIQRKVQGGGTFHFLATVGAGQVGYTDSALTPELGYTYRVAAFNGEGQSGFSNESFARTPAVPNDPVDITVQVQSVSALPEIMSRTKSVYHPSSGKTYITASSGRILQIDPLASQDENRIRFLPDIHPMQADFVAPCLSPHDNKLYLIGGQIRVNGRFQRIDEIFVIDLDRPANHNRIVDSGMRLDQPRAVGEAVWMGAANGCVLLGGNKSSGHADSFLGLFQPGIGGVVVSSSQMPSSSAFVQAEPIDARRLAFVATADWVALYDAVTEGVSIVARYPDGVSRGGASLTRDANTNKLYAVGGWTGGRMRSEIWQIDARSFSIELVGQTPTGMAYQSAVFDARRGVSMFFGGEGFTGRYNRPLSTIYQMDPAAPNEMAIVDGTVLGEDMLAVAYEPASNRAVVVMEHEVKVFDPNGGMGQKFMATDFPHPEGIVDVDAVHCGGETYLMGGHNAEGVRNFSDRIYRYNTDQLPSNPWELLPARLPVARSGGDSICVNDQTIYAIGGQGGSNGTARRWFIRIDVNALSSRQPNAATMLAQVPPYATSHLRIDACESTGMLYVGGDGYEYIHRIDPNNLGQGFVRHATLPQDLLGSSVFYCDEESDNIIIGGGWSGGLGGVPEIYAVGAHLSDPDVAQVGEFDRGLRYGDSFTANDNKHYALGADGSAGEVVQVTVVPQ